MEQPPPPVGPEAALNAASPHTKVPDPREPTTLRAAMHIVASLAGIVSDERILDVFDGWWKTQPSREWFTLLMEDTRRSVLHIAARYCCSKTVMMALLSKAEAARAPKKIPGKPLDPNDRVRSLVAVGDAEWRIPLFDAVRHCSLDVVKVMLVEFEDGVMWHSRDGRTVADIAATEQLKDHRVRDVITALIKIRPSRSVFATFPRVPELEKRIDNIEGLLRYTALFLNPNEDFSLRIHPEHYESLKKRVAGVRTAGVVALGGNTMVGKTTLMRLLGVSKLDARFLWRLTQRSQGRGELPESSDVSLYLDEVMRQLFLDLEGKGGSAAPSLDPFFPEIPDSAREHYSKLRTECVNETLPRLAYLLSDVVIWIAGGEKANSNNFKESLELLTKSCIRNVRAAASKELQPALILVMNKRQLVDVTAKGTKVLLPDDAIAERSASFFGGDNPMTELKESLDTIFSKVLVFDLPDWSSVYMDPDDADAEEIRGIDVFLNRFKHLKKAIQQAIADRQMERAASENLVLQSHVWLAMMQELIKCWSENVDMNIIASRILKPAYKIARSIWKETDDCSVLIGAAFAFGRELWNQCQQSPRKRSSPSQIVVAFEQCKNAALMKLAFLLVRWSIVALKRDTLERTDAIHVHFTERYVREQAGQLYDLLEKLAPCAAYKELNGGGIALCTQPRNGHGDEHTACERLNATFSESLSMLFRPRWPGKHMYRATFGVSVPVSAILCGKSFVDCAYEVLMLPTSLKRKGLFLEGGSLDDLDRLRKHYEQHGGPPEGWLTIAPETWAQALKLLFKLALDNGMPLIPISVAPLVGVLNDKQVDLHVSSALNAFTPIVREQIVRFVHLMQNVLKHREDNDMTEEALVTCFANFVIADPTPEGQRHFNPEYRGTEVAYLLVKRRILRSLLRMVTIAVLPTKTDLREQFMSAAWHSYTLFKAGSHAAELFKLSIQDLSALPAIAPSSWIAYLFGASPPACMLCFADAQQPDLEPCPSCEYRLCNACKETAGRFTNAQECFQCGYSSKPLLTNRFTEPAMCIPPEVNRKENKRASDKSIEMRKLVARARIVGLQVADPRCTCLFTSLSHQLSFLSCNVQLRPATLRADVVSWLKSNPDFKLPNGKTMESFVKPESWDSYCSRMAQPNQWADQLAIIAAAETLRAPIRVLSSADNKDLFVAPEQSILPQLVVGHVLPANYVSLVC